MEDILSGLYERQHVQCRHIKQYSIPLEYDLKARSSVEKRKLEWGLLNLPSCHMYFTLTEYCDQRQ